MSNPIASYSISDKSKVKGDGKVALSQRTDAISSGVFRVTVSVAFDPATNEYPTGSVKIEPDLSDSTKSFIESTTIEQVNTHGKHTPTAIIAGRCKVKVAGSDAPPKGCRFWLLVSDNRSTDQGTPDIVSFIVYDRTGKRVSYGTGPLDGSIAVDSTSL
jgi:hypothetical protein